ncbi:MAG: DNA polymerase Y family protein [Proteobacteria bacterium]|nr:DNA polymerase Y family protein [Pseudomonadota bacterium]
MRTACLLVPDLPLRAELRARPELAGRALVIASGPDARAEVIALSPEAGAAGVRARSSVTQARSICPEVRVQVASPPAERAARETLLDVALSCSPRAAPAPVSGGPFAGEAAVYADATGVGSLFRSEHGFATALSARAAAVGLPGIVTVASSRSIAHLVARAIQKREEVHVLAPGAERAFLDPLPLDLLEPDDEVAQTLTRFGVRTVCDLLRLPRRGLVQRLGPRVLELVTRARGAGDETPLPEARDTNTEESLDLDHPLDQLEPLLFVLRGLLSRILERLTLRGLACPFLDLDLRLSGGGRDVRRIDVSAASRDAKVLLRLASLSLESRPPDAPIESVILSTRGRPRRTDQLDLFRPRGPDPAVLDQTLAELASLCGEDRVGAPEVADDHRPDAFTMDLFRPGSVASGSPSSRKLTSLASAALPRAQRAEGERSSEGLLAVRALRPPVAAEVRVRRGRPDWLRSAVASGPVLEAAGPWRTTGRWWSEDERFAVDHYDVQVADGTVLRLCFDWIDRTWRIDAVYD